jgi:serine/threonine protein kinase HipA of HipAB toxin-antitoxin module
MVGNTDMHFGNFGFLLDDARPLTLCPSYDKLPMLYRPASNGRLVARGFTPPTPLPAALAHWHIGSRRLAGLVLHGSGWQDIRASPRSLPA